MAERDEEESPTQSPFEGWTHGSVGSVHMTPVPIPHDCTDTYGAYWRRPEAYLDAEIRSAMSAFARIDAEAGLARLRTDLASGLWAERNRHLLALDALDVGHRLVRCEIEGQV